MENNQATIIVMSTGNSQSMRYANRTQRVSFRWLKQQFERGQFDLLNVGTLYQVADILTKVFPSPSEWLHALRLIGIGAPLVNAANKVRSFEPAAVAIALSAINKAGLKPDAFGNAIDRLLIEFYCSADSKLGQTRAASKGCKTIRIREEDGTSDNCRQWLENSARNIQKHSP